MLPYSLLRAAAPYAIAAAVGFGAAWWLQGVRLDAERNATAKVQTDFDNWKVEQQRLKNEADAKAEQRRKETQDEWIAKYEQLRRDGEAYRRCVAAGKCGGLRVVPACPRGADSGVPAPERTDAPGADAVPPAGESAPPVIEDCAMTTLMLNQLQADIEKQYVNRVQ